ncbi:hypothetical protein G6N74_12835 [Mesorhizobium sp. CGMCC 1.15528]|uniref:Uncharacterized protein n=1 Tax=Mesorhizobium zhangyense TaxID=1776730 RepID=A0A7C9VD24_9HYPH|nr:hypothetical protein [Mesorhizobium zhangyense]NGN41950.1 hypothetical protein [Mesorhizobium zhangyense]
MVSLGYVCAVFAAVFVSVFLYQGSSIGSALDLMTGIATGLIFTFPTALPGFILALYVAKVFERRHWLFFSIAGALNVLPAFLFLELFFQFNGETAGSFLQSSLPLFCLPGGFLGGLSFWLVAHGSSDASPKGVTS